METTEPKLSNHLFLTEIARISFLDYKEKETLFNSLSTSLELSTLTRDALSRIIGRRLKAHWDGLANHNKAVREVELMKGKNVHFISIKSETYPALLRKIDDPPFMLYCLGNPNALKNPKIVSIVGTRRITKEAKSATEEFSREAVKDGYLVASGLAIGVDGAAHTGAVDAFFDALDEGKTVSGATCAVLPCSIDKITPTSHKRLAMNIIKSGGCLISENSPLEQTEKWCFTRRNRIIAGLSECTIVMQSPNGSGSLITAEYARKFGRALFFHKVAFSESSKLVASEIKKKLEVDYANGKVSKEKVESSCEKYIDSGSPIISNYESFKKCLEAYRTHPKEEQSPSLFDL